MSKNNEPFQSYIIYQTAFSYLALEFFFYVLIDGFTTLNGVRWSSWLEILAITGYILFVFLFLVTGLIFRRAYLAHIFISLIFITLTMLFLSPTFQLGPNNLFQITVIVSFCVLNFLRSYRLTSHKFATPKSSPEKTGRLDRASALWDLSKPLLIDKNQERGEILARILIPLAAGLGVTLSNHLINLIFSVAPLILGVLWVENSGTHWATVIYLRNIEKRIDKAIKLK